MRTGCPQNSVIDNRRVPVDEDSISEWQPPKCSPCRAGQRAFNGPGMCQLGRAPTLSAPEQRPRTPAAATSIDNFGKRSTAQVYADSLKTGAEPTVNEIRCRGYSGTGGSEYVFFTI